MGPTESAGLEAESGQKRTFEGLNAGIRICVELVSAQR